MEGRSERRDRPSDGATERPRGGPPAGAPRREEGRRRGLAAGVCAAVLLLFACGPSGGEGGSSGRAGAARSGPAPDSASGGSAPARTDDGGTPRYGIRLTTDRAVYAPGDTIRMRLEVFRRGGAPLTLSFPTAQRYDFVLRGPDAPTGSSEIWRWSDGRFFAQATGTVTLDADRPVITATARHPAPADPGLYRVEGELAASEWPISAVVPVTVAP